MIKPIRAPKQVARVSAFSPSELQCTSVSPHPREIRGCDRALLRAQTERIFDSSTSSMPRMARIRLPRITFHIVQRGNNRSPTFFETADYRDYLHLLQSAAQRYATQIHAYVLMTNHVHLLATSDLPDGISSTLRHLGSRYVSRVNKRYGRTGSLWESRYKSSPVDSARYCLACYRYIELNPVRAGIVQRPEEYHWSSYRSNAAGKPSSLVTSHPVFLSLGATPEERRESYCKLVREALEDDVLSEIRRALRKGLPSGDEDFRRRIESSIDRPLGSGRLGRPRKVREDVSG